MIPILHLGEPDEMLFEQALVAVRCGAEIARKSWPTEKILKLVMPLPNAENNVCFLGVDGIVWIPSSDDLMAFDWIIRSGEPVPSPFGIPMQMSEEQVKMMEEARMALFAFRQPLFSERVIESGMCLETFFQKEYTNGLPNPQEFSLYGFNLALEDGASAEDRAAIKRDGIFTFQFLGGRTFLKLPLSRFPEFKHSAANRELKQSLEKSTDEEKLEFDKYLSESIDFRSGEGAYRFRPTETFNCKLSWPTGLVLSKPVKVTIFLEGVLWSPV